MRAPASVAASHGGAAPSLPGAACSNPPRLLHRNQHPCIALTDGLGLLDVQPLAVVLQQELVAAGGVLRRETEGEGRGWRVRWAGRQEACVMQSASAIKHMSCRA